MLDGSHKLNIMPNTMRRIEVITGVERPRLLDEDETIPSLDEC